MQQCILLVKIGGRDSVVGIATRYGLLARAVNTVGSRLSATVQTGHEAQMGKRALSWVYRGRGVRLTRQPNPCMAPRLKKVYSYTCNPPLLPSRYVDRLHCTPINVDTISPFKDDQSGYVWAESSIKPENDGREFLRNDVLYFNFAGVNT